MSSGYGVSVPRRRLPEPVRPARAFSREVVVDAALRILDAEGLDAVTMRRVALDLDTGPASLYAHVRDKKDLYAALVDRVISEIPVPEPDPEHWQEQLKEVLRQTRVVYGRHRDIARAALGVVPIGDAALPSVERLLGIVLAGGVSHQVAAWALDITNLYVTATAFEESLEDFAFDPDQDDPHHHAELETFMRNLPAETYPNLVAMAVPLTTGDRDERFEFGVDMIIRGIASTVPAQPRKGSKVRASHGPAR